MTAAAKRWYHKTIFQVMFHIIAWILFFSLPNILSMNARQDRILFTAGRSVVRTLPADSLLPRGRMFPDPGGQRARLHRNGTATLTPSGRPLPVIFTLPSIPSVAISAAHFVSGIGLVLLFYFNAYLLIPGFLYKRRRTLYFSLLLIAFLITNMLGHFTMVKEFGGNMPLTGHIVFNFFPSLLIITASTLYRYIKDKIRNDQLQQEKENEQLKTELSFLRSQISPHFLFNVMNSAVSLARSGSSQLEETLIKISTLLRYMLYGSEHEKVSLLRETEYLGNYIELQKLRFGDRVDIFFTKKINDTHALIEPMLLIPFVENAFKHGTDHTSSPVISIRLRAEDAMLFFEVRNRFEAHEAASGDVGSGIGLPNVQRRLQLLYPGKHQLLLHTHDNWFIAELTIHLS